MADCMRLKSESENETPSLKTVVKTTQSKLLRLVTLVNNMKKSPWLLSRCKESRSYIQALSDLLRPEDVITVAVKLDSPPIIAHMSRYLVVVSTGEKHKTQESAVIGVDASDDVVTIGLVLPICDNMDIQMDGDGGFNISAANGKHSFHPVSVQAMWSALQSLVRTVCHARYHHQNLGRTPFAWLSHYSLSSSQDCIFEWNRIVDADFCCRSLSAESTDDVKLLLSIKRKLRDIMTNENDIDLETVTSKILRERLEAALNVNLMPYKRFVDEEMVIVMRQLDSPSQILDYLYLGSEWNASNLEELQQNRIGYILNVTREIDNFFPGMFKYCNVRVDDTEETQLIRHWSSTNKFISEAKKHNSRILVHCKMGVSRSASTVIAYVMKECGKPFIEAYQHVKQKRSCVKPNAGFMDQLNMYEGILGASKQRHNKLFRSRSAETLDTDVTAEEDRDGYPSKRLKNDEETPPEDETKQRDSNENESSYASEEVTLDTNSNGSNARQATFSIDSVDSFSPGSIPAIGDDNLTGSAATVQTTTLLDVEEDDDEVLCDHMGSGVGQRDGGGLLSMAFLDDLALPISSMLRKLSFQHDGADSDAGRQHDDISESTRRLKKEESINEVQVRTRSFSWPQRRKDAVRSPARKEASIIRPNANRHRKLRGRRSNTIAFD